RAGGRARGPSRAAVRGGGARRRPERRAARRARARDLRGPGGAADPPRPAGRPVPRPPPPPPRPRPAPGGPGAGPRPAPPAPARPMSSFPRRSPSCEPPAAMANVIGQRIRRVEDRRFLTGQGRYVDGLRQPGEVAVTFVRAEVAHARIASIDAEAARALPG